MLSLVWKMLVNVAGFTALLAAACAAGPARPAVVVLPMAEEPGVAFASLSREVEGWGWRVDSTRSTNARLVVNGDYELRPDGTVREVWMFTLDGAEVSVDRTLLVRTDDGAWTVASVCEPCDRVREREIAGRLAAAGAF